MYCYDYVRVKGMFRRRKNQNCNASCFMKHHQMVESLEGCVTLDNDNVKLLKLINKGRTIILQGRGRGSREFGSGQVFSLSLAGQVFVQVLVGHVGFY